MTMIVSVVSCLGVWRCFTRQLPSCVLHNILRSAHLNRQNVSISSIGRSCESCVKKYRSWLSDSDCQSLGKDKLKNASILRKYGSICMGEKTRSYCRLLSRISRRIVGSLSICSFVRPCFSTVSRTCGYSLKSVSMSLRHVFKVFCFLRVGA